MNDADQWRLHAEEHMPTLRETIKQAQSHVDLWQLLKELVADAELEPASLAAIRPIFDYAWWCVEDSGDDDMVAAIETYFYEDIPAFTDTSPKIEHFIDGQQFTRLRQAFSARINDGEFSELFAAYL